MPQLVISVYWVFIGVNTAGIIVAKQRRKPKRNISMTKKMVGVSLLVGICGTSSLLRADDTNAPPAPAEDTRRELQVLYDKAPFGKWLDDHRVTIWGHVDQGVTGNFDDPNNRLNFGRLFDDRANDYRLNQVLLTIDRVLAPEEGK